MALVVLLTKADSGVAGFDCAKTLLVEDPTSISESKRVFFIFLFLLSSLEAEDCIHGSGRRFPNCQTGCRLPSTAASLYSSVTTSMLTGRSQYPESTICTLDLSAGFRTLDLRSTPL